MKIKSSLSTNELIEIISSVEWHHVRGFPFLPNITNSYYRGRLEGSDVYLRRGFFRNIIFEVVTMTAYPEFERITCKLNNKRITDFYEALEAKINSTRF